MMRDGEPANGRGAAPGGGAGPAACGAPAPTVDELRGFVLLAEDPHFGRTAARLGIAQSSLSEGLRRLEAKVDAVLFERSSRRVALTEAGARLLPRARAALEGVAAVRSAALEPEPPEGTIRVGIESNGFAELTRPVLAAIRDRFPGAPLVIRECHPSPVFLAQGLDVGLVRSHSGDERVVVHEVAAEPRGVLVPAGHPMAGTRDGSIEDLLDERFVAVVPETPAIRDHWLAAEHRGGEPARIGGEAASLQEVVHAVAHLGLVTTAGRSIPRAVPAAGVGFAEVPDLAPTTLGVAVRSDDDRPLVSEIVELVRRTVADLADLAPDVRPLEPA